MIKNRMGGEKNERSKGSEKMKAEEAWGNRERMKKVRKKRG